MCVLTRRLSCISLTREASSSGVQSRQCSPVLSDGGGREGGREGRKGQFIYSICTCT